MGSGPSRYERVSGRRWAVCMLSVAFLHRFKCRERSVVAWYCMAVGRMNLAKRISETSETTSVQYSTVLYCTGQDRLVCGRRAQHGLIGSRMENFRHGSEILPAIIMSMSYIASAVPSILSRSSKGRARPGGGDDSMGMEGMENSDGAAP